MPPKKVMMEETIKEMNETLKKLTQDIRDVVAKQTEITNLLAEIRELRESVAAKDLRIVALENKVLKMDEMERRIQDMELFIRKEDVIISGLDVKARTYAAAVTKRDDEKSLNSKDQESLETQVISFLQSRNIHLDKSNITACHILPRKDRATKPRILMRFVNRKHKTELLVQGKKLKGTAVYINEHLTSKNAEIARVARQLWKERKIKATWTRDCKVLIRLNGPSIEAEKVLMIRELKDLDCYK